MMKHNTIQNKVMLTILLVEDNEDHAELILRSLEDAHICNNIYHVKDGEQALNYLFRRDKFSDPQMSPRPHVILLDLRLPKIDGLHVLHEIKRTKSTASLPVVILTTSQAEADIAKAYHEHANSYLIKPVDFDSFRSLIEELGSYWFTLNHPPQVVSDQPTLL